MPVTRKTKATRGGPSATAAEQIHEQLAERIGRHKYDMWFGHTRLQVDGPRLEVSTDSQFVAKWIDMHFAGELTGIARQTLGEGAHIDVRVAPDLFGRREPDGTPPPPDGPDAAPARRAGRRRDDAAPGVALRRGAMQRQLAEFVVGQSNHLAYSASQRLAEDTDAAMISPLFIHGECGVGKTHLLQGACRRFAELGRGPARVRYMTGEQFTNEYIASLRSDKTDTFRRRMRKLELLAIDDVHFLSNKVRTQSEFLHTLDAIDLTGARVILASDEHPRLIKRFSQALISRFLSGMVVKIERPDRATRLNIIQRLGRARGLTISDAAIESIAAHCVGSVRELEGVVTKLAALSELQDVSPRSGEIGMLLVQQLFDDHDWQPATPVRIGTVIDEVCARLGVSRNDLMGSGRHRRIVLARALVAHLGRELTTHSYPEIANALGRSYHSTVHTAAQRLRSQLEKNQTISLGGADDPVSIRELADQLRHEIRRATARA